MGSGVPFYGTGWRPVSCDGGTGGWVVDQVLASAVRTRVRTDDRSMAAAHDTGWARPQAGSARQHSAWRLPLPHHTTPPAVTADHQAPPQPAQRTRPASLARVYACCACVCGTASRPCQTMCVHGAARPCTFVHTHTHPTTNTPRQPHTALPRTCPCTLTAGTPAGFACRHHTTNTPTCEHLCIWRGGWGMMIAAQM